MGLDSSKVDYPSSGSSFLISPGGQASWKHFDGQVLTVLNEDS